MLSAKLKEAAGNSADATLYVDDVFSTWLYTGNGSTQTITNGIDLAGKGGLVWIKKRSEAGSNHKLTDTVRGATKALISNTTDAQTTDVNGLTTFSSTGFSLGTDSTYNMGSSRTFVSWTFREAAKFFDVVTYTGTGSARTIAHSLGVAPGMVIVKRTNTTGDWQVYSNGMTSATYSMQLNLSAAQASAPTVWNSTAPTSSVFSVGTDATVNASGGTYVAYLFAHDTSSTGIIQCGSFTTDPSGGGSVNLGWEPQYVMVRNATSAEYWRIYDSMRGMTVPQTNNTGVELTANTSNAETTTNTNRVIPNAIGFTCANGAYTSSQNIIYMAIRRPNKPPTSGAQVFNPASGVSAYGIGRSNTSPDLFATFVNKTSPTSPAWMWSDRLRGFLSGGSPIIDSTSTAAENTRTTNPYFNVTEPSFGTALTLSNMPTANSMWYAFRRAPSFFDEVCYTETGVARAQAHNLGVVPELIIQKARSLVGTNWNVSFNFTATTQSLARLNFSNAALINQTYATIGEMTAAPTATNVNLTAAYATNTTVVMYLFATLAGISKVGSYTGNGSTQNINCGFAAGARFILIKCTSTTGDWYVWDSARGIVSGNDPHLSLNTTAAEVTTDDSVDPYSAGFTVNQVAATNINVSSATYIFLAIA